MSEQEFSVQSIGRVAKITLTPFLEDIDPCPLETRDGEPRYASELDILVNASPRTFSRLLGATFHRSAAAFLTDIHTSLLEHDARLFQNYSNFIGSYPHVMALDRLIVNEAGEIEWTLGQRKRLPQGTITINRHPSEPPVGSRYFASFALQKIVDATDLGKKTTLDDLRDGLRADLIEHAGLTQSDFIPTDGRRPRGDWTLDNVIQEARCVVDEGGVISGDFKVRIYSDIGSIICGAIDRLLEVSDLDDRQFSDWITNVSRKAGYLLRDAQRYIAEISDLSQTSGIDMDIIVDSEPIVNPDDIVFMEEQNQRRLSLAGFQGVIANIFSAQGAFFNSTRTSDEIALFKSRVRYISDSFYDQYNLLPCTDCPLRELSKKAKCWYAEDPKIQFNWDRIPSANEDQPSLGELYRLLLSNSVESYVDQIATLAEQNDKGFGFYVFPENYNVTTGKPEHRQPNPDPDSKTEFDLEPSSIQDAVIIIPSNEEARRRVELLHRWIFPIIYDQTGPNDRRRNIMNILGSDNGGNLEDILRTLNAEPNSGQTCLSDLLIHILNDITDGSSDCIVIETKTKYAGEEFDGANYSRDLAHGGNSIFNALTQFVPINTPDLRAQAKIMHRAFTSKIRTYGGLVSFNCMGQNGDKTAWDNEVLKRFYELHQLQVAQRTIEKEHGCGNIIFSNLGDKISGLVHSFFTPMIELQQVNVDYRRYYGELNNLAKYRLGI